MSFFVGPHEIFLVGIINITPNSFSDGGKFLNPESICIQLTQWADCVDGLDIGAESTAPKSSPLTQEEEWSRLDVFFQVLKKSPLILSSQKKTPFFLSLDTYRSETIFRFAQHCREHNPQVPLVWNDVSGVWDEAVEKWLSESSTNSYILSHNPVRDRACPHEHKKLSVGPDDLVTFFTKHESIAQRFGTQVIFDPAFGFGKNRQTNHDLLKCWPELQKKWTHSQWMWGLSRKSFLRFPVDSDPLDPRVQVASDALALVCKSLWLRDIKTPQKIFLRVHDPTFYLRLKEIAFLCHI